MPKKMPATTQMVEQIDCVQGLNSLPSPPHLIVADSPYNFQQLYADYSDDKAADEFLAWLRAWLSAAQAALHKHGALWVFAPDEWVSDIDVFARHALGMTKQNHVIWAFTFGQAAQQRFTRSKCHILYFTKSKTRRTFNADALRVPSARQLVYGDKRAQDGGKLPDDTWMLLRHQLEPFMQPDKDMWLQSRVCGTFKERQKHSPNQLPIPLLERIVRATSNPGDLVVDPFVGTGTSGVVCKRLGRNFLGFDISKAAVKESERRIATAFAA